jgi:monoamine oxidase
MSCLARRWSGCAEPGNLRIFGKSNEKYHVRGGNDQIPALLAAQLTGQIVLNQPLTAIKQNPDSTYQLTFKGSGPATTVTADRVVLAIPFSVLRASVDFSAAGFKAPKQTAINELGMGTNSKLHVQFSSRYWNSLGCNGATFADTGYQSTWEVSRAQPGASGILVDYTGGTIGASFGSGTPDARARQFLSPLEPVLPGITGRYNGKATVDYWTGYQWTRGPTPTGRSASTQSSPGWNASRRAPPRTATSPGSTPRSSPRATSTAEWRPVSAPPARSSTPSAKAPEPGDGQPGP